MSTRTGSFSTCPLLIHTSYLLVLSACKSPYLCVRYLLLFEKRALSPFSSHFQLIRQRWGKSQPDSKRLVQTTLISTHESWKTTFPFRGPWEMRWVDLAWHEHKHTQHIYKHNNPVARTTHPQPISLPKASIILLQHNKLLETNSKKFRESKFSMKAISGCNLCVNLCQRTP